MKYVIIHGNPVDGFQIHGPFDSPDNAVTYAETFHSGDWWTSQLFAPTEVDVPDYKHPL